MNSQTPLISFIVPIYNVEEYLLRCLESLTKSLKKIPGEIICIEDCSQDNSRLVLDAYASGKTNLCVIYNEVNKGLAESRNIGVAVANGKYIWFVDSDDWIESEKLECAIKLMEHNNLDILAFDYCVEYGNEEIQKRFPTKETLTTTNTLQVVTGKDAYVDMCDYGVYSSTVTSKIFRRNFIESIRFANGILHEDEDYTLRAFMDAERVMQLNEKLYHYYKRENSIMTSVRLEEKEIVFYSLLVQIIRLTRYINDNREKECLEYQMKVSRAIFEARELYLCLESIDRDYINKHQELKDLCFHIGGVFYGGYFPYKFSPQVYEVIKNKKNIYIYGAGAVGKYFYELISERGIRINGFVKSDAKKGETCMQYTVYGVSDLPECVEEETVFFIMHSVKKIREKMKENLLSVGINKNQIYTYDDVLW